MNDSEPPEPKRRWCQLRLWQLFVLTTVVAILCAAAARVRQTRQQRGALAVVWRMGGLIAWEDGTFVAPLGELDCVMRTRSHGWVDDLIGDESPVAVLFSSQSGLSDEGVEVLIPALQRLPRLRAVFLEETQVTGEAVRKLQEALPDCEIVR